MVQMTIQSEDNDKEYSVQYKVSTVPEQLNTTLTLTYWASQEVTVGWT